MMFPGKNHQSFWLAKTESAVKLLKEGRPTKFTKPSWIMDSSVLLIQIKGKIIFFRCYS